MGSIVFLNTPMDEIFKFPSEDLAVQDALYFILIYSIADYGGWWVMLYSFGDGVHIVGS